jgi:hypothetical protein
MSQKVTKLFSNKKKLPPQRMPLGVFGVKKWQILGGGGVWCSLSVSHHFTGTIVGFFEKKDDIQLFSCFMTKKKKEGKNRMSSKEINNEFKQIILNFRVLPEYPEYKLPPPATKKFLIFIGRGLVFGKFEYMFLDLK